MERLTCSRATGPQDYFRHPTANCPARNAEPGPEGFGTDPNDWQNTKINAREMAKLAQFLEIDVDVRADVVGSAAALVEALDLIASGQAGPINHKGLAKLLELDGLDWDGDPLGSAAALRDRVAEQSEELRVVLPKRPPPNPLRKRREVAAEAPAQPAANALAEVHFWWAQQAAAGHYGPREELPILDLPSEPWRQPAAPQPIANRPVGSAARPFLPDAGELPILNLEADREHYDPWRLRAQRAASGPTLELPSERQDLYPRKAPTENVGREVVVDYQNDGRPFLPDAGALPVLDLEGAPWRARR